MRSCRTANKPYKCATQRLSHVVMWLGSKKTLFRFVSLAHIKSLSVERLFDFSEIIQSAKNLSFFNQLQSQRISLHHNLK